MEFLLLNIGKHLYLVEEIPKFKWDKRNIQQNVGSHGL
jgi:hypothetical protein